MTKIEEVKKKIMEVMPESPNEPDPLHAINTLDWLMILEPDADDAMQVAALGHDIDRAVNKITDSELKLTNYAQYKKEHAIRSATVLKGMLEGEGFAKEFVDDVVFLTENHETGGDERAEAIKDADSISYFDVYLNYYFKRDGREKTIKKIAFSYGRSSERAKKIIKTLDYKNSVIRSMVEEA